MTPAKHKLRLAWPAWVVSLAPSNTEILFTAGAGAQVVGRDELSDYPAEAQQVASIGSTYGELNAAAIQGAARPTVYYDVDGTDPTAPDHRRRHLSIGADPVGGRPKHGGRVAGLRCMGCAST